MCVIRDSQISGLLWQVDAQEAPEEFYLPRLCCRSSYWTADHPSYYGAFMLFQHHAGMPEAEECTWEDAFNGRHGPRLVTMMGLLCSAVWQSFKDNEAHIRFAASAMGHHVKSVVRSSWQRPVNYMRRLLESKASRMPLIVAFQDFERAYGACVYKEASFAWESFVAQPPAMPMIALKPGNLARLCNSEMLLTAVRRWMHNELIYSIFTRPLIAHCVGVVGATLPAGKRSRVPRLQMWGDFSEIKAKGVHVKHCPIWVCRLDHPVLRELWMERQSPGEDALKRLWSCGRRYAVASATADYRNLKVWAPGDSPEHVAEADSNEAFLTRGDNVYIIVFDSQHVLEFQYRCLQKLLRPGSLPRRPLQELLGRQRDSEEEEVQGNYLQAVHRLLPFCSFSAHSETLPVFFRIVVRKVAVVWQGVSVVRFCRLVRASVAGAGRRAATVGRQ